MIPLIFFDPLFTGGDVLNAVFRRVFGASHVSSYPPEPVSRGRQVERAASAIWFNGFSAFSANFHASRETLPYAEPYSTCTVLDHPLDRLYAQYIHFGNLYLRFPDYAQGVRPLPEPLSTLAAFSAYPGHDNQLVRFFAELESAEAVTPAHLDRAVAALQRIDHVWPLHGLADALARLGHPLAGTDAADALAMAQVAMESAAAWRADVLASRPRDQEPPPGARASVASGHPGPRLPLPAILADWLAQVNRFDLELYSFVQHSGRTA